MAIAVQSSSSVAFSSADPIVIPKPTGLAVGDLMYAFVFVNTSGGTNQNVANPAGWSGGQIAGRTNTAPYSKTFEFYRIADSADVAASNFSFPASGQAVTLGAGGMLRITGFNSASIVGSESVGGAVDQGASLSFTGPTPANPNSLLIFIVAGGQEAAAVTTTAYAISTSNPTWTEAFDLNDAGTVSLAVAYAVRPEVTATGTATATLTGAAAGTTDTHGGLICINPGGAFIPKIIII